MVANSEALVTDSEESHGRPGIDAALGHDDTGIELVARARACGEGVEVGIDRFEERGDHLTIIGEQHALLAEIGMLELALTFRIDPSQESHGSPEDLGQPLGGGPLDDRQNQGGGVGPVR